ncbi:hypothetical protein H632_c4228p0, partial [Helicosporidium sp. ATCC 50920]
MVTRGEEQTASALLPSIVWSTEIEGRCTNWGSRCTLDAKRMGRIFHITSYEATQQGPVKVVIKNIRFLNGQGWSEPGGAVSVVGNVDVTFVNCEFAYAQGGEGGAVAVITQNLAKFEDCVFRNNEAVYANGGAVTSTAETWFTNAVFYQNVAQNGGAVQLDTGTPMAFFLNANFTNNWAYNLGGSVY